MFLLTCLIVINSQYEYNLITTSYKPNIIIEMSGNKVAVVTGANRGLGLAIVKGLCQKFNGTVCLTARDEKRGKNACEQLQKLGLNPVFHQLDVTIQESISSFCKYIQDNYGKVDVIVNNAAILLHENENNSKFYVAEQMVFVNFLSLVNFTEAMLPLMKDGGKIVNISSSSGHLSRIPSEELRKKFIDPQLTLEGLKKLMDSYVDAVKNDKEIEDGWGDNSYVVSKVGVSAYTFILHRSLAARGISVNCVHPGYVMTDMTGGAGNVTPEEGAEVPLRLALEPEAGGLFLWHDGQPVPWDGPDPRGYIDGKKL